MAATQVVALPNHVAGGGIQTGGAEASEMDINPSRLDGGRGGGVTIHGRAVAQRLRVVGVEHLFVVDDSSRVGIHAYRIEIMAVRGGGGHPDLAAQDDRGGPAEEGDFGLPSHVIGLAPMEGEAGGASVAVAGWPAEFRPIGGGGTQAAGEEKQSRRREGALARGGQDARENGENGFRHSEMITEARSRIKIAGQ